MRQTAALFFVLLLTLPLWVKGMVLLHFWANRAYIAERFCENKDKPQLHCEGKCYLHKQLKKAEPPEKDSTAPPTANWLKKWELADFDFPRRFFDRPVGIRLLTQPFFHYGAVALRGFPNRFEPPPDDGEPCNMAARSPSQNRSPFNFSNHAH